MFLPSHALPSSPYRVYAGLCQDTCGDGASTKLPGAHKPCPTVCSALHLHNIHNTTSALTSFPPGWHVTALMDPLHAGLHTCRACQTLRLMPGTLARMN
eukprot:350192-Chlamydomonas_euryale.AAC.6